MTINDEVEQADKLLQRHGADAEVTAQERAIACASSGDLAGFERWAHIAVLVAKMLSARGRKSCG